MSMALVTLNMMVKSALWLADVSRCMMKVLHSPPSRSRAVGLENRAQSWLDKRVNEIWCQNGSISRDDPIFFSCPRCSKCHPCKIMLMWHQLNLQTYTCDTDSQSTCRIEWAHATDKNKLRTFGNVRTSQILITIMQWRLRANFMTVLHVRIMIVKTCTCFSEKVLLSIWLFCIVSLGKSEDDRIAYQPILHCSTNTYKDAHRRTMLCNNKSRSLLPCFKSTIHRFGLLSRKKGKDRWVDALGSVAELRMFSMQKKGSLTTKWSPKSEQRPPLSFYIWQPKWRTQLFDWNGKGP